MLNQQIEVVSNIIYDDLVKNHASKSKIITAKQLTKRVFLISGLNITPEDVRKCIKFARSEGFPKYPYVIKSVSGEGYYIANNKDKDIHSAPVKQFIGLARHIMQSGECKKGYLHTILRELETELLPKGQINEGGQIYYKEVDVL